MDGEMRGVRNIERGIAVATGSGLLAALAFAFAFAPGADASRAKAPKIWVVGSGTLAKPTAVVRAKPKETARRLKVLHEFRRDYSPQYVVALSVLRQKKTGKPAWYRISVPGRPNGQ